ncbi:MAG: hypothetical protein WA066_02970 [Candidatus Omnitrophota bacterium]
MASTDYKVTNDGTIYGYDLTVKGPWVDARAYTTFALALTAAANKTLIISNTQTLLATTTIPSTVSVMFLQSGKIILGNFNLAFNGHLVGNPMHQMFDYTGTGVVTFGSGSVKEDYPEWWGAKGDGVTDCSVAFQNAMKAYDNVAFSKGTYIVNNVKQTIYGQVIHGVSPEGTILKGTVPGAIFINDPTQPYMHFNMRDFTMNSDSGSGCGGIKTTSASLIAHTEIKNIVGYTDKALIDLQQEFSTRLDGIQASAYNDHAIILEGGNTTALYNCYAHFVGTGYAGYRIYSGHPTFVNCNGVDTADYWGIFGNDSPVAYSNPTFIGCNIEEANVVGLKYYNGSSGSYIRTIYWAPSAGIVIALQHLGGNKIYFQTNIGDIHIGTKGASFANGYPIHSTSPPFINIFASDDPGQPANYSYYRDSDGTVFTVDGISFVYTYLNFGIRLGNILVDGNMSQGLANNQQISYKSLTELTTIAAAAFTDTEILIPANVIVKAVSVRVTTVIPTAATFTVIGATSTTVFNTVAVSTALNTTNKGNLNCPYNNAAAQKIRITPNATPANTTGRVRVTIWYEDSIPPTS